MHAAVLAALLFIAPAPAAPLVIDDVDTIAICHSAESGDLIFFFGLIQGEWGVVDHRWPVRDMQAGHDGQRFTLSWLDESEYEAHCFRLVRALAWIESWQAESPLAERNARPWFAQMLAPGLRQPAKQ